MIPTNIPLEERLAIAERELQDARTSGAAIQHLIDRCEERRAVLFGVAGPEDEAQRTSLRVVDRVLQQMKDRGIPRAEGAVFPELQPLVGRPGLALLEERMATLEDEIRVMREELARWAGESSTVPHRYVGPPFAHHHGGRYLQPGDVVPLTRDQASAFADRFEFVTDEAVTEA